jgi:hypothetical protein
MEAPIIEEWQIEVRMMVKKDQNKKARFLPT